MDSHRFPRTARVRARADFDRIFKHGRRVALPVLALHWQSAEHPPRLGLAVSRKVDPRAVGRNRIKRVLRDSFRHHRDRLPAADYVLVARRGAADCNARALRDALFALLARAGALPLPTSPGTMPADPDVSPASSTPRSTPRVG